MSVLEQVCFFLSRRMVAKAAPGDLSCNAATFDLVSYREWRELELRKQFSTHFSPAEIQGKRVLDFGCGGGELSFFVSSIGAHEVIGMDLSPAFVDLAQAEAIRRGLNRDKIHFLCGLSDRIPLPDSSVDIILCFDVMEHIIGFDAIIAEWRRVLVPSGKVMIWWVPWFHPYGHHLHTMIPLPWVHVVMSDATLLRVCARIYDTREFQPRWWHFDESGNRKSNPYANQTKLEDLNKLTTWKFERICRRSGFAVARKGKMPFTGPRFVFLKKILASLPRASDFFCSCVIYELQVS